MMYNHTSYDHLQAPMAWGRSLGPEVGVSEG